MLAKAFESTDQFQLFLLSFATASLDLCRGDVEPLGNYCEKCEYRAPWKGKQTDWQDRQEPVAS